MKKNLKKLRLSRETLTHLDVRGGVARAADTIGAEPGIVTSCTQPCGCPGGCSEEDICVTNRNA
jgi:hypothetical protein